MALVAPFSIDRSLRYPGAGSPGTDHRVNGRVQPPYQGVFSNCQQPWSCSTWAKRVCTVRARTQVFGQGAVAGPRQAGAGGPGAGGPGHERALVRGARPVGAGGTLRYPETQRS